MFWYNCYRFNRLRNLNIPIMKYLLISTILVFTILTVLSSCKSKSAVADLSQEEIANRLAEVFESKKYKCTQNEIKDLRLCIADDDPTGDRLRKVYAVYNDEYQIVYGPKKVHGKVFWTDDDHVMLEIYPRVIDRSKEGDQIKREKIKVR